MIELIGATFCVVPSYIGVLEPHLLPGTTGIVVFAAESSPLLSRHVLRSTVRGECRRCALDSSETWALSCREHVYKDAHDISFQGALNNNTPHAPSYHQFTCRVRRRRTSRTQLPFPQSRRHALSNLSRLRTLAPGFPAALLPASSAYWPCGISLPNSAAGTCSGLRDGQTSKTGDITCGQVHQEEEHTRHP